MNFKFNHNNLNVRDLEKSIQFYKDALGLTVVREKDAADGSFKLVYLSDGSSVHQLELTWLRDMDRPYDLGDNEILVLRCCFMIWENRCEKQRMKTEEIILKDMRW